MMDNIPQSINPIPAFYCCYLLRSTVRHASLYIGSTPEPSRRLAQHNGDRTGGARKTSSEKLRPWEMVAIVSGFMNRAGALQFEWAWQHTKESRHAEVERCESEQLGTRGSSRTGKEVKRAGKPRTSLPNILENLHILLRSPYFSEWPLEVRFFSADVWQVWSQPKGNLLDNSIKVVTAFSSKEAGDTDRREILGKRIETLDTGYDALIEFVEKSQFLLESEEAIDCGVCKQRLNPRNDMIAICSHSLCRCASHLLCLSAHFLEAAGFNGKLIPKEGTCPACLGKLEWPTIMKEITLRLRGQEEVKRLLGRRRRTEQVGKRKISNHVSSEKGESDASMPPTDAKTMALPIRSHPSVGGSNFGKLERSVGSAIRTNTDNGSEKAVTPEIEFYRRRKCNAKTNFSGLYRTPRINISDWDNAEIIE
ncbi:GIY-YIG catalytic domain-containing protein [Histoplasma capsulatum var. duboisii H88]|uniref:GIY-YIG catalytic domain-containing protein n=3 Tax=Ajellomyces capsulatus TaxID=5037 RepID=A0A8A1LJR4_AJEC8|nr:GIY-YIG catalytic domain-containing protein [Histoplasma capsulatum var. duboisii H88]